MTCKQKFKSNSQNQPKQECNRKSACGDAISFRTLSQVFDYLYNGFSRTTTWELKYSAPPVQTSTSSSSEDSKSSDFSKTNNQVQGVDEADIIKTDGDYIYSISDSILSIILAYPAHNAKVVSKIEIKEFKPIALFVEGNYLAVIGTTNITLSA